MKASPSLIRSEGIGPEKTGGAAALTVALNSSQAPAPSVLTPRTRKSKGLAAVAVEFGVPENEPVLLSNASP